MDRKQIMFKISYMVASARLGTTTNLFTHNWKTSLELFQFFMAHVSKLYAYF